MQDCWCGIPALVFYGLQRHVPGCLSTSGLLKVRKTAISRDALPSLVRVYVKPVLSAYSDVTGCEEVGEVRMVLVKEMAEFESKRADRRTVPPWFLPV